MRECFGCRALLPRTEFYAHPRGQDGLQGTCKECCKRAALDRYHRKMKDQEWVQQERGRNRERMRAKGAGPNWTAPEAPDDVKQQARNALGNAVRDGKTLRPDHCGDCGKLSKKIHGHHTNYFQPLNVAWVCPACHRKRHAIYPERCTAHLKQSA